MPCRSFAPWIKSETTAIIRKTIDQVGACAQKRLSQLFGSPARQQKARRDENAEKQGQDSVAHPRDDCF